MGLTETTDWLLSVERSAMTFYDEVAQEFTEDAEWSKFFRYLSAEEEWHAEVMVSASEYLVKHIAPPFAISVDDETKEKIEAPFIGGRELLSADSLDKENAIDCLARAEFSEWNDIFVYVMKSFGEERQFMHIAAKMDGHLREIEQFMASLPEGRKHLHIIRSLPRLWKQNILIIDDDLPVLEFLKKLLDHEGQVEMARNGKEALQKLRAQYFNVIISDIEMPVMSGIEFYSQASAIDPEIGKRIVFFSGFSKPEHYEFIRKNNLKFLIKPAPVREIVKEVSEMLHKTNTDKS